MTYAVATAALFACLFVWAMWLRPRTVKVMYSQPDESLNLIQADKRIRELTAQIANLHADRAELQDERDDLRHEMTRLRSELWSERKLIRDLRKLLGPERPEMAATGRTE